MGTAKVCALGVWTMLNAAAWAQSTKFDIAAFTAPAGFSRQEANGNLLFQAQRRLLGREQDCQIYLFASRASEAAPGQNFQSEWQSRVAGTMQVTARPTPQEKRSADGWTMVTGGVDVALKGVPVSVILFTATGFGKTMTFLILVSPNAFQPELKAFIASLRLDPGPSAAAPPAGPPATLDFPRPPGGVASAEKPASSFGEYGFTAPPGWPKQEASGRMVLTSQPYSNGERCQITMLPLRASSRPLADDAIATFRDLFRANPLETYPTPPPRLSAGMAPGGWEYFQIHKLIGGQEGTGKGTGAVLLLAKLGGQVATIAGTSKDFLVSNCFGELVRDMWPPFFYSLQFQSAHPPADEETLLRRQLAGDWTMATGTVGLGYTFAVNGRFASVGSHRVVTAVSSTELLSTTTTFFGDGAYTFQGNQITLTRDGQAPKTYYFRVQKSSRDAGNTWQDQMCMLEPGASGEVCYRKN